MEPIYSANTKFLLDKIVMFGAKECQKIGGLVGHIKKFNREMKFSNIFLPYANIDYEENSFEVRVLGFDGKLHAAKILFDSGCDSDSIIGTGIATRAGMTIDKFGVSYVYVVRFGSQEFFGYSIANSNNYSQSHIEDMCGASCVTKIDDQEIDIIIGYRTMMEMAQAGINFRADIENNTIQYRFVPYRQEQGLKCNIAETTVCMQIESGNFFDEDVVLSSLFVENNKSLFVNITGSAICLHGIIPVMTIRYKNLEVKLYGLKFVAYPDISDDGIECIGGIKLIKSLSANKFLVRIIND